jgi:hypothetical protein
VDTLPQLRQKLSGIIDRYLDVQQDILETLVDREELRQLTQPTLYGEYNLVRLFELIPSRASRSQ